METEINYVLNQRFTCTEKELLAVEKHILARIHLVSSGEPYEFGWLYGYQDWYQLSKGQQNFKSTCMSYSSRTGRLPFEKATEIREKQYPLLYTLNSDLLGGNHANCQID